MEFRANRAKHILKGAAISKVKTVSGKFIQKMALQPSQLCMLQLCNNSKRGIDDDSWGGVVCLAVEIKVRDPALE